MESVKCPICGEELPNRMRLGSHMWTAHKVKLKEYEAKQAALYEAHTTDGLIQPGVVTESKEFVTETTQKNDGLMNTQTQPKQDKDIVTPPLQSETTIQKTNILNEGIAAGLMAARPAQPYRREMSPTYNPYKDMYKDDNSDVMNEYLGRNYGK